MNRKINSIFAIGIIVIIAVAFSAWLFFNEKQSDKLDSQPQKSNIILESKKITETKNLSNQRKTGFIKSIYLKNNRYFLTLDYFDWLSGAEAEKAMRADGVCSPNPKVECIVYNDYYIRNKNKKTETLEITPEVKVLMQTWTIGQEGGDIQWNQPIKFTDLVNVFNPKSKSRLKDVPYNIEIDASRLVVGIVEEYIP